MWYEQRERFEREKMSGEAESFWQTMAWSTNGCNGDEYGMNVLHAVGEKASSRRTYGYGDLHEVRNPR